MDGFFTYHQSPEWDISSRKVRAGSDLLQLCLQYLACVCPLHPMVTVLSCLPSTRVRTALLPLLVCVVWVEAHLAPGTERAPGPS